MGRAFVMSAEWRAEVNALYLDGYGAEDIAVKLGCRATDVWRHFAIIQNRSGQFSRLEKQRKNLWLRRWRNG